MRTNLEYILTHSIKEEMIAYISTNPSEFDELIQLALSENPKYSWRAAWLLWSCMEYDDGRVRIHIPSIIDILPHRGDSHARELMIILQQMNLEGHNEGQLFETCTQLWMAKSKQASVRLSAFKLMAKIADSYPELKPELELLTDSFYLDTLSSAVRKAIAKLMSEI